MAKDHTFVTPGPAGLGALAVVCFGFGALFTSKVGLDMGLIGVSVKPTTMFRRRLPFIGCVPLSLT